MKLMIGLFQIRDAQVAIEPSQSLQIHAVCPKNQFLEGLRSLDHLDQTQMGNPFQELTQTQI